MNPQTNNVQLRETLIRIYTIVIDWVKYAETKNAVTLAFSGAAITAIVTYLGAKEPPFNSLKIGLLISIFLIAISMLISVISFLPKTDVYKYGWNLSNKLRNVSIDSENDNFYSYNDLRKYVNLKSSKPSPDKLLDALNEHYYSGNLQSYTREEKDLCLLIILNSDIAFQKFILSGWSLFFNMGALLATPICMLFSLIISHSL